VWYAAWTNPFARPSFRPRNLLAWGAHGFVDNPIITSPFEKPAFHYELDENAVLQRRRAAVGSGDAERSNAPTGID
jgi:hypothetical protein